jgi:hypothetical protein
MDHLFLLKILMDHLGSKKTNHQDNLMHKYMHGSPRSKPRTFQIHSRVVAVVCFVGVATAISWSKLVPMWTWSSVMTDRRMESLNDVKHIVNGKDRYTDGKIPKLTWDMYLSSRRKQAEQRWWGGGAVNCNMSNPCCTAICCTCCNAMNEY